MPGKLVELLYRDGKVYRRVTRDLVGVRVVTSEIEVSDDVIAYAKLVAPTRIIDYHGHASLQVKEPSEISLTELETYLQTVDSVDVLLRMRKLDPRKGSIPMYESRLNQMLDKEFGIAAG
jgi:hypothetical protein